MKINFSNDKLMYVCKRKQGIYHDIFHTMRRKKCATNMSKNSKKSPITAKNGIVILKVFWYKNYVTIFQVCILSE